MAERRERTTTTTYAIENVMWAIVMVVAPRFIGQPIRLAIEMNRNSSDSPVMISGMTSGAVTMPDSRILPRRRTSRCSASATMAPSAVAKVALRKAILRLSSAASSSFSSSSRLAYQRSEKPPQSVTSRESLKE